MGHGAALILGFYVSVEYVSGLVQKPSPFVLISDLAVRSTVVFFPQKVT